MKLRCVLLIISAILTIHLYGQHRIYDENVRTLQVTVDNNTLQAPVLKLGHSAKLRVSWDEMSHDYHHYTYRIQHCTRDWQESTDIFESDYLSGNNDLVVEDYETSFNTTQLYTHYSLTFPNSDASVLLSGNYKLLVYEEDSDDDGPVLEVRFMVVEDEASVSMQVSSNTDIDFNNKHQQVSIKLNYGALNVIDPYTQIYPVVVQNRRESRTISGIRPDINKAGGLEWAHCEELIFPAGKEYLDFEILDERQAGKNVDYIRWLEPYYHAVLWANKKENSYTSDKDHNGTFFPRTEDQENNGTHPEYIIVHFALESPRLGEDIYVNGQWSNGELAHECKMEYNEESRCYEAAIMLKQGYYEYQYLSTDGHQVSNLGDFWQTENEYQTFIYYKEIGGRYDRLVGYQIVNTNF